MMADPWPLHTSAAAQDLDLAPSATMTIRMSALMWNLSGYTRHSVSNDTKYTMVYEVVTRTDPRPAVRPAEGPNSFH